MRHGGRTRYNNVCLTCLWQQMESRNCRLDELQQFPGHQRSQSRFEKHITCIYFGPEQTRLLRSMSFVHSPPPLCHHPHLLYCSRVYDLAVLIYIFICWLNTRDTVIWSVRHECYLLIRKAAIFSLLRRNLANHVDVMAHDKTRERGSGLDATQHWTELISDPVWHGWRQNDAFL